MNLRGHVYSYDTYVSKYSNLYCEFSLLTHLSLSKSDSYVSCNDKIIADYGEHEGHTSLLHSTGIASRPLINNSSIKK